MRHAAILALLIGAVWFAAAIVVAVTWGRVARLNEGRFQR